jgi:hypothetical protein
MMEHVLPKHRVAAAPVLCFLDISGSKPRRSTGSLLFEDNQRGKGLGSDNCPSAVRTCASAWNLIFYDAARKATV